MKRLIAGALLSSGVGMAGFGLAAGTAQAQPGLAPQVHWCPNQPWNPAWGENKYWNRYYF